MRKKPRLLLIIAALGFVLTAALKSSPAPEPLVIAAPALPKIGEMTYVWDPETGGFLPNVYEGLVRFKPRNCDVAPHLATEWHLSPDGRTWTFKIRSGVRLHDGSILDAGCVKAAFDRKLRAAARFPHLRFLFGMVEEVTAPDPEHVSFRLEYPYAPFLRNLALPQACISTPGSPPAGTGPYRIERPRPNSITLRAFEEYWGPKPAFKKVRIQAVPKASERLRLLKERTGIVALNLPPGAAADLPPFTVARTTAPSLSYLGFYTSKPPFDNPAARRAVALALDRKRLCRILYSSLLPEANGPLPPVVFGATPEAAGPAPDPAEARDLADRTGLRKRPLVLLTYRETRPYNPAGGIPLAEEVKRQLEAAGLKVKIRVYPWEELKAAITRQEGDAFLYGWTSDNGDPDNFLFCLLAGSQIARGFNTTLYRDPLLDVLLSRAQQIPDSPTRAKLYRQVQLTVARELPFISLNYGAHIAACTADLQGFSLHPLGTYDLAKIKQRQH
ncbi:MAG: ABC transporter substrate-binding protein [Bacillota bacterium]